MPSQLEIRTARSHGQALVPATAVATRPRQLPIAVVGSSAIAERLAGPGVVTGDIAWLRCGSGTDVSMLERIAATIDASQVRILQHSGTQPVPRPWAGAQLRVTGARPQHDVLLAGCNLAFIFDRDRENRQVMTPVSQASVSKALLGIFDHLWTAALPVVTEVQLELSSEDRRIIIRMLGDGATDDAIARALGISRRTIARHVAQIMQCTGALSRFQAGMRLAQLGLLAGGHS